MEMNQLSTSPFEKIAMGMSGGGYRAGAFHLGALSYLNKLEYNGTSLLSHIRMISTVSGGSITGIVYVIQKQEGKSFEEIYQFLLKKLESIDLVQEGIKKLNPDAIWSTTTKRKNLINAFSELYDKHFTGGKTLGFLGSNTGLETFVFNSTEFTHAINFRFKNKGAGYSGNNSIRLSGKLSEEIKLSDIMASSSCFPGGFEPMIWPYDFVHKQSVEINKLCKNNPPAVGIMDGGIYDNQGIEAILNYQRGKEKPYFDLIIVSDVTSPYMPAYSPFKEGEKKGVNAYTVKDIKKKVKRGNTILNLSLILSLIIFVCLPFLWEYSSSLATGLSLGFSLAVLLLLITKLVIANRIKVMLNGVKGKIRQVIPAFYYQRLSFLQTDELSLHRIEPLLMDRINSLITLLLSVFLKVVRRLNYRQLYTNDLYKFRRASNLIQELTRNDFDNKKGTNKNYDPSSPTHNGASVLFGDYDTVVGKNISAIAELAASF